MRHFLRATLALIALAFIAPLATARAQSSPDSLRLPSTVFVYVQFGDTIAYEAVFSDTTIVRGAYLVPKQGRIGWDHALRDGTPGDLNLSFLPPEYQGDRPYRQVEYAPRGDSMVVVTVDWEQRGREALPSQTGAIPAFGRSMTHLAYLGFYAIQARRSELPLFLTSSGKTVQATVSALGETLSIVVDGLRVESEWEGGALLEVRVPSQGLVVQRMNIAAGGGSLPPV